MFKAKDPQSFNEWLEQIDKFASLMNKDPYKLTLLIQQNYQFISQMYILKAIGLACSAAGILYQSYLCLHGSSCKQKLHRLVCFTVLYLDL